MKYFGRNSSHAGTSAGLLRVGVEGAEWPSSPEAHKGVKSVKVQLIVTERAVGARRRARSSSCVTPFNEFRPMSGHRRTQK